MGGLPNEFCGSSAMPRWYPSRGRATDRCSMSGAGIGPWAGGCARPSEHAMAGAASPDAPRARTHAHHIRPWADGGETAMNNLVLLCPFHHRAVSRRGLAGRDGRTGSSALLQSPGRSNPGSAGGPGHRCPGAPRRLVDRPLGVPGSGPRSGSLARPGRHRCLDRNHAVDGRTRRLGLGNVVPLEGRG